MTDLWRDEARTCDLCGASGITGNGIVRWKWAGYDAYDAVIRCRDRDACRVRAIKAGRPGWIDGAGRADPTSTATGAFTPKHYRVFEAARQWREQQARSANG